MNKYSPILWRLTYAALLLAIFTVAIQPFELFDSNLFYVFQSRDLERARQLKAGVWVFFGPEMTGGGNLPGPAYSALLLLASFINQTWIGGWWLQFLLAAAGGLAGSLYFYKRKLYNASFFWIFAYSLAPLNFIFLTFSLNVSCLIFFVVTGILGLHSIFNEESEIKRIKASYVTSFIIGLGLQFHFSIIILFISFIFLVLFAKRLNIPPLRLSSLFKNVAFFLLPSFPYLVWLAFKNMGIPFGLIPFYSGMAVNAPLKISLMAQFNLNQFLNSDVLKWLQKIALSLPVFLFLIPFLRLPTRLIPITVVLLFSLPLYMHWFFSPQAIRYTMPFYISMIFFLSFFFEDLCKEPKKLKMLLALSVFLVLLFFYFAKSHFKINPLYILTLLFLALLLLKNSGAKIWNFNSALSLLLVTLASFQFSLSRSLLLVDRDMAGTLPTRKAWQHIWDTVSTHSGWNYEEARKRIYYINHHMEQDPELFWTDYSPKISKTPGHAIPDGYLISNRYPLKKLGNKRIIKWILQQPIQEDLRLGIINNELVLGRNLSNRILIVPYWNKAKKNLPTFFQNNGQGYKLSSNDLSLRIIKNPSGVFKINPQEYLLKWNSCPNVNEFCSTGSRIKLIQLNRHQYQVNLKIFGAALSQVSPWISPDWTESWDRPYLNIKCEDEEEQFFQILSSIGYNRLYAVKKNNPTLIGNNSIIAPLERVFEFSCQKKLESLKMGMKGIVVDKISSLEKLPGSELKIIF